MGTPREMSAHRQSCDHELVFASPLITSVLAFLVLAAPSHALMVGAESNGEIVNSNVTPQMQRATLERMRAQGSQLVRANFGWNEIAAACGGQTPAQLADHTNSCYNWTLVDSFAQTTAELGLVPLISLTRVPSWANASSDVNNMGGTSAQFTQVMNHYVALHQAAGTRYRTGSVYGTINYWTIHNEPNSARFWAPRPNAERYGLLYARTAVALRAVHPLARIAPGPTNPTGNGRYSIRPLDFVRRATIAADKYLPGTLANRRSYMRYWAHNPYPAARHQPSVSSGAAAHIIGMARLGLLVRQLDAHPLTKGAHVWATEFGWETSKAPQVTSAAQQAQFIAEAFDWMDSLHRVDIGVNYGLTDPVDPVDWQSGTYTSSGQAKPAVAMMRRMISVPAAGTAGKLKAGKVKVWGRSNVAPKSGQLVYRKIGGFAWKPVPGQRRAADGSIRSTVNLVRGSYQFAVRDAGSLILGIKAGTGPTRSVLAL